MGLKYDANNLFQFLIRLSSYLISQESHSLHDVLLKTNCIPKYQCIFTGKTVTSKIPINNLEPLTASSYDLSMRPVWALKNFSCVISVCLKTQLRTASGCVTTFDTNRSPFSAFFSPWHYDLFLITKHTSVFHASNKDPSHVLVFWTASGVPLLSQVDIRRVHRVLVTSYNGQY